MHLDEYQQHALRTWRYKEAPQINQSRLNAALGLAGESGEFCDLVKKLEFHGKEMTREVHEDIVKELGDILYYVAAASAAYGMALSDVAAANVAKLRALWR